MGVIIWSWAQDAKLGVPETPSNRRYRIVGVVIATVGGIAMAWGGGELIQLSLLLAEKVKGV